MQRKSFALRPSSVLFATFLILVGLFGTPLKALCQDLESVEQAEVQVSEEEEVASLTSSEAISFLYLDYVNISYGMPQNIVIALSDYIQGDITSAEISMTSQDETDSRTYHASAFDSSAMLFTFEIDGFSPQAYQIQEVLVNTENGSYRIAFDDCPTRTFEVSYPALSFYSTNDSSLDDIETTIFTLDENGGIEESATFSSAINDSLLRVRTRSLSQPIIALDPGHGGYDSGALASNGAHEADLTWKIANYCKDELVSRYGAKVIMTRSENECPSLKERAERASAGGAAVLVSIHLNSGGGVGSEVWVPNNSSYNEETHSVGTSLANKILDQLTALGLTNRGVKTRDYPDGSSASTYPDGSTSDYYGIIREARRLGITGIIVEHAFIDSESDYDKYLSSDEKLRALGVADANGIAEQFNLSASLEEKYAAVYNYDYYVNKYPDIRAAFGENREAAAEHFVEFGMAEGRQGSASFDVSSYFNRYTDLRAAFGLNLKLYYEHYMAYGMNEGRDGTHSSAPQLLSTTLDGIDYSPVYNPSHYLEYDDMKSTFNLKTDFVSLVDDLSLIRHFVNFGMKEGRSGNESFDVASYYNRYEDLRRAFGRDLPSYYLHYIQFGKGEGRLSEGYRELVSYVSSRGEVNYSGVYDGGYYAEHNADVKAASTFSTSFVSLLDDSTLLSHFLEFGMKEGRRGSIDFNVKFYRATNPDLNAAFGSDLSTYYEHYLKYGQFEGRNGKGDISDEDYEQAINGNSIMGSSRSNASQMARYYRLSVGEGRYPAQAYSLKGAPTIDDFCRIVYEEAEAEGVRAEVVFCQSMHETGWLGFGGQVNVNQCNFAGLGADNTGAAGASFSDVRTGVRAQVQHLKAYASTEPLVNECVDPRFNLVNRGVAPLITDLNGRWAVPGDGYGEGIISMIDRLLAH